MLPIVAITALKYRSLIPPFVEQLQNSRCYIAYNSTHSADFPLFPMISTGESTQIPTRGLVLKAVSNNLIMKTLVHRSR